MSVALLAFLVTLALFVWTLLGDLILQLYLGWYATRQYGVPIWYMTEIYEVWASFFCRWMAFHPIWRWCLSLNGCGCPHCRWVAPPLDWVRHRLLWPLWICPALAAVPRAVDVWMHRL